MVDPGMHEICPMCGETDCGQTCYAYLMFDDDEEPHIPCEDCNGTGQDRYDLMPCRSCDGRGWLEAFDE